MNVQMCVLHLITSILRLMGRWTLPRTRHDHVDHLCGEADGWWRPLRGGRLCARSPCALHFLAFADHMVGQKPSLEAL